MKKETMPARCLMRLLFFLEAAVFLQLTAGFTQAQQGLAGSPRFSGFEVASIREDRADDVNRTSMIFKGNQFVADSVSLRRVVEYAFGVPDYQLGWKSSHYADRVFTIRALISDDQAAYLSGIPASQALEIKRTMVQELLKTRFGLREHREMKDLPAYTLAVSKKGIKFPLTEPDNFSEPSQVKTPQIKIEGLGKLHAERLPFASFVKFLSEDVGRPVIDQTGLRGAATFDLNWAQNPDAMLSRLPAGWVSVVGEENRRDQGDAPQLPTALHEQLGLILEYHKAPQSLIVVDQVNLPSEN